MLLTFLYAGNDVFIEAVTLDIVYDLTYLYYTRDESYALVIVGLCVLTDHSSPCAFPEDEHGNIRNENGQTTS